MQSALFAHAEAQSQERYAVQNPQLLRVSLTGHDDVLARKGAMVAYQGIIDFDGEYQSTNQRTARARTGEGLDLMRCSGQGTVYLANLAQYVHVVDVDQDGLTVDSSYVLAMDSTLHTEAIAVDSQYGISGSGKYQLNITGRGKVALMTSGQPLMMQVTPDKYVNADADAIVAWSTSLRVQMQAQTHSTGVWQPARQHRRGLGAELPRHRFRPRAAQRGAAAAERPARPGRRGAVRHGPARLARAEPEQRLELAARRRHGQGSCRARARYAEGAAPGIRGRPFLTSRRHGVTRRAVPGPPPAAARPRCRPPPPPPRTGTSAGPGTPR